MSDADSEDDPAAFHERLDELASALEIAETEAELDDVEADLDAFEADLADATLPDPPEPEDDEEEAPPDPREELEDRLGELRDDLEAQRGPYAHEATALLEDATGTIESTEWAEEGREELVTAIESVQSAIGDILELAIEHPVDASTESQVEALDALANKITEGALHPDDDTPTIAALIEAAEDLTADVEAATAFGDLPVREQLNRRGFFDILGHYKDFPPEWSAIKAHEEDGNAEMILLAFDLLDSNYMEEHCIDALRRLGDPAALDEMMGLARRRNTAAIEVLGKIGDPEPVDMLLEYVDADSDRTLQQTTLTALGEIGDPETTDPIAQLLAAESPAARSAAARALGMIGDPRAIEPLADVLAEDEAENVRGSAAWALVQIGTEPALDIVRDYQDDESYLVEAEAAKATA